MTQPSESAPAPTDFSEVLKILSTVEFEQGIALERQVASQVRRLVETKQLAPHTRLPPIRTIAELWDTNYFTVQAGIRKVVSAGLLVQSPKLGTFVGDGKRVFRKACIYHDHDLSFEAHEEFFSKLNLSVYRLLAERGIQVTTYFDHRSADEMASPPKELRDMIRENQIDAIIASGIKPGNSAWLTRLGIPFAAITLPKKSGGILLDYPDLANKAVDTAADAGRKRMGVILRKQDPRAQTDRRRSTDLMYWIETAAARRGIELVVPELERQEGPASFESVGYHSCEALLTQQSRVDALFVFPDVYTRGAVSALLKHDVEVPKDMLLISHQNAEASFFTPFPVTWLQVKIESFAKGLMSQIDLQFAGEKPKGMLLSCEIQRPEAAGE